MGKMFKSVGETWNPVTGCLHGCKFCYARILAEGKLRHMERYKDGFESIKIHEKEFRRRFRPGVLVFIVDMGDLFGWWVENEWIERVIEYTKKFPQTTFLFLTKNPERYHQFVFPGNALLGTTLETNRDLGSLTEAPSPSNRYVDLVSHPHKRKFVSIEPIMDFDLDVFLHWIADIQPELIEVGADNWGFHLSEPTESKIRALLSQLNDICPKVVEKDGLGRLLNGDTD